MLQWSGRATPGKFVDGGTEIDLTAQQVASTPRVARAMMDKTRAKRRYLLADELPKEPHERQCEGLYLVPVKMSGNPCIRYLQATGRALHHLHH